MKKYINISLSIATVLLTAGCSLFEKTIKAEPVISEERSVIKTGKAVTAEVTLTPEDKKQPLAVETPENNVSDIVIKGDWAIETVFSKKAKGEYPPYLKFDPERKAVYGCNGCNIINGDYSLSVADSTLTFSNVLTTMKSCGMTDISDIEINNAINAAKYFSISNNNSDYMLTIYNANHTPVMVLMHQEFQFLNGTWRVTAIDEEPQDNPEMKLVIDVDQAKLHGNTGCNLFNGILDTDMETVNAISFRQIVTTRMACPDSSNETSLLVALEEAMFAQPVGSDKVVLLDADNRPVLEMMRADSK